MTSLPPIYPTTNLHTELIHGAAYQLGDLQLPLQALWNPTQGYWTLCHLDTETDTWKPLYALLGRIVLIVLRNDGRVALGGTRYTVDDLRLVDALDLSVWGEIAAYVDRLPSATRGEVG